MLTNEWRQYTGIPKVVHKVKSPLLRQVSLPHILNTTNIANSGSIFCSLSVLKKIYDGGGVFFDAKIGALNSKFQINPNYQNPNDRSAKICGGWNLKNCPANYEY